ncbi:hypothetical protein ACFWX5_14290 [[Kitasatospora] papulosa]|uniref:hypothetical protein n=1 Tax=[Kitasatospora] papulosa TaxID=1464011 RepID=UPI0036BFB647
MALPERPAHLCVPAMVGPCRQLSGKPTGEERRDGLQELPWHYWCAAVQSSPGSLRRQRSIQVLNTGIAAARQVQVRVEVVPVMVATAIPSTPTPVSGSRRRPSFRPARDSRKCDLEAAGTATAYGRGGTQALRTPRGADPGAQSVGGEASPLVQGRRAATDQRAQRGLVLGVAWVQGPPIGSHPPAAPDGAGVVVDGCLHDPFVQAGLVRPTAQGVGKVAACFGKQMVACEGAAHYVHHGDDVDGR